MILKDVNFHSLDKKQSRISHKADEAKYLGPAKKKGPTKVKNE